jgi:hypothetical protein
MIGANFLLHVAKIFGFRQKYQRKLLQQKNTGNDATYRTLLKYKRKRK